MRLTGVDVFDNSIERTCLWLQDLMRELNWSDRTKSYLALRYVLQGVRDHLAVEDAVAFGNQLPMLIRGFYFEDWDPAGKPLKWQSRDELLNSICSYLQDTGKPVPSAEVIVRAVFRLLERKASEGEIQDLHHVLPPDLRELWPPTLRAA